MIYCSNCHGEDGTGNGPIAKMLKIPPTNLTLLKKEGMEEFPFESTYFSIDGRSKVKTHGDEQMPIWGDAFGGKRAILINELI
ncbi:MAG: hypothetical protein GY814_16355, partial [Gammaproteobacteria bacterium]|nr:hypothetical protein [Gammaproteobacteria bacterium]